MSSGIHSSLTLTLLNRMSEPIRTNQFEDTIYPMIYKIYYITNVVIDFPEYEEI